MEQFLSTPLVFFQWCLAFSLVSLAVLTFILWLTQVETWTSLLPTLLVGVAVLLISGGVGLGGTTVLLVTSLTLANGDPAGALDFLERVLSRAFANTVSSRENSDARRQADPNNEKLTEETIIDLLTFVTEELDAGETLILLAADDPMPWKTHHQQHRSDAAYQRVVNFLVWADLAHSSGGEYGATDRGKGVRDILERRRSDGEPSTNQ
ncbi:MAG: hypothetical protein OXG44_04225 [Gammaproteobacteria bacterium]|nr:hypothetical protein [Gammaproteobacteria bacterium]